MSVTSRRTSSRRPRPDASNYGASPSLASLATVVIPIHSESRWDIFLTGLRAVQAQAPPPAALVVAVDHNPHLLRRITEAFPQVHVVENGYDRGASGARNSGALATVTPLLVFVDSDIVVGQDWLARLLEPLASPQVIGTGGFVAPRWTGPAPRWFPEEFGWVVGISYVGQPTETSVIRNVWSSNMAVRRDAFLSVGGFRVAFSKVDNSPKPEDTDFCVRTSEASQHGTWVFVPSARVEHEIGSERRGFGFFVWRCFSEGRGKMAMAHLNHGRRDLADESDYVRRAAPAGAVRYLRRAVALGDLTALVKCLAIIAGLTAASFGATTFQLQYLIRRTVGIRSSR